MSQLDLINYALLNHIPVIVLQADELIGAGIIFKHTRSTVVLGDGMHYVKQACEFRIKL